MSDGDYKQHHAVFVCKRDRGGGGEEEGSRELGGGAKEKEPQTVMGPTRWIKRMAAGVGTIAADQ